MKKNQLFVKYLIMNLSLVFVIFAGCLADVVYTYNLEKKNIIEQNEAALTASVERMEEMLNSIYSISSALRSNDSLQALSSCRGETLPVDKYVFLNYLQKDLADIQMIANISATGFILFRDNQVLVSNAQTTSDFEDYYGVYLEAEGQTAEEFKKEILGCSDRITCRTYPGVKVFNSGIRYLENPLVVTVRITESNRAIDKSVAFVFVIEQEELYSQLFLREDTGNLICICDREGSILSAFGEGAEQLGVYVNEEIKKNKAFQINGSGYYLQRAREDVNGNSILIAVPTRQVEYQTLQLIKVILLVLLLVILVSFAEIVFFSYRKSSSMQGLLDHINKRSETKFVNGNEYKFIQENVELIADSRDAYQKDLARLRSQMENNMLEQLFLQEITPAMRQDQYRKLIPPGIEFFYVLVVQCQGEDQDILLNAFYTLNKIFADFTEDSCLNVQTAVNEKSFLIGLHQDPMIKKKAERLELALQKATEETGEVFHMGISGIGMDFSNIHSCYIQAKQALICYSREHTNTVGYYSDLLDNTGDNLTNMDFVSKLYQYLISGEKQLFLEALDKLIRHYRINPYLYERNIRDIYYSIHHTLLCAATELSIPERELSIVQWADSLGFEAGIENLKEAAARLLDANEKNKKSHNHALKESITNYIDGHFQDPNLTAAMVCQEMKISEKYLVQFLKEQTGKTFAKYVEDLRIEKAKDLLCHTDYSNEKIAETAGFGSPNSFYRVFNKRTGVTPGVFRKNQTSAS
ncbi:MAG: helix-turn-helix transcriptional regulator [Candidatus Limivivens sp.]|nr:helix-turn-helix transcriptional regulator [Candidatus Limivivens sp.]